MLFICVRNCIQHFDLMKLFHEHHYCRLNLFIYYLLVYSCIKVYPTLQYYNVNLTVVKNIFKFL